jgi:spermidine synthase
MKQPAWKKMLSFFVDFPLESAASNLNPELQLNLRNGRYCLTTPNAIYSYGDLYDNFRKAFKLIPLETMNIQEVLVLGFGMGSIPYMLEKIFRKNYCYTGIERDEVIAAWASRYVIPELRSPVTLKVMDAGAYIRSCSGKYDLIVMDIFVDDVIPSDFETPDFLTNLNRLLNENGLLLYNRLSLHKEDLQKTSVFFQKTFKAVFPRANYLDVGGNWILKNH